MRVWLTGASGVVGSNVARAVDAANAVEAHVVLVSAATAAALGVELPGVDAMLARLRRELDRGRLEAA